MKKSRKLATLGICSALFLGLAAYQQDATSIWELSMRIIQVTDWLSPSLWIMISGLIFKGGMI